jgi:hypothetical protein
MVCRVRWTHVVMHECWIASLEKIHFLYRGVHCSGTGTTTEGAGSDQGAVQRGAVFFFFFGSAWRLFDRERNKTCWGPRP